MGTQAVTAGNVDVDVDVRAQAVASMLASNIQSANCQFKKTFVVAVHVYRGSAGLQFIRPQVRILLMPPITRRRSFIIFII